MVCYSRTGTTAGAAALAAQALGAAGHAVTETRLEPRADLPYPLWLALSFAPRSRFPLRHPPPAPDADACLLALPKWTFSCPPVNEFLARIGRSLPPTGLLVTCGGWDQARYTAALAQRLMVLGVPVLGTLILKRRDLEAGVAAPAIRSFVEGRFGPVRRQALGDSPPPGAAPSGSGTRAGTRPPGAPGR